jgi:hypothetical protein
MGGIDRQVVGGEAGEGEVDSSMNMKLYPLYEMHEVLTGSIG